MTERPQPPIRDSHSDGYERRLPPALEEEVQGTGSADAGWIEVIEVSDLLDWLYGGLVRGGPVSQATPGLLKRVMNRANELFESGWDIETAVEDAIREELGEGP